MARTSEVSIRVLQDPPTGTDYEPSKRHYFRTTVSEAALVLGGRADLAQ
jgi:hypothetical protein